MRFELAVAVEVERVQGKFASRDEVEAELLEALNDANPGTISGIGSDATSEYEVTDWVVE